VEFGADIVGLSSLTPNACLLNPIIDAMRAAKPDAFCILGGPHASTLGAKVLDSVNADAAVCGEGELTFERFLRAYMDGEGLSAVPGLIWRDKDGVITANPGSCGIIEDLDVLPMPAYDLIDLTRYWKSQSFAPMRNRKYISLLSTRGCPFQCVYCHKIFGKKIRAHSAERVIAEIEHFKSVYGVDDIEFIDDMFNFDSDRLFEVSDLMRKRDIRIRLAIPNGIRGDLITQEQVDAMRAAGLYHCMIPLETGSPRIQKLVRKNLNIERFLKACEMVDKAGVYIHSCNMMGFPSETEEELRMTIDVACQAKTHTASFFTVIPFPGTALHEMVMEKCPEKIVGLDFDKITCATIKVNLTDLPNDVFFSYPRAATRRYYCNPRRISRLVHVYPNAYMLPVYTPLLLFRSLFGVSR
jgi:radical SAM superfamily enzyme YgiQ (UPF0313 family)